MNPVCEWCGASVLSRRADIKYCSTAHRVAAHREARKHNGIPAEMRTTQRWVRHDKKRPIMPNGRAASSTAAATWSSYGAATISDKGQGLGYVLGAGIGCIDLDHCVDNGQPTPEALALIANYPDNWIEYSPSGTGLHIWGSAEEQPGFKRNAGGLSIEFYSVGRFITITGKTYQSGKLSPL